MLLGNNRETLYSVLLGVAYQYYTRSLISLYLYQGAYYIYLPLALEPSPNRYLLSPNLKQLQSSKLPPN